MLHPKDAIYILHRKETQAGFETTEDNLQQHQQKKRKSQQVNLSKTCYKILSTTKAANLSTKKTYWNTLTQRKGREHKNKKERIKHAQGIKLIEGGADIRKRQRRGVNFTETCCDYDKGQMQGLRTPDWEQFPQRTASQI